ncbi:reverse transcriptase [Gossypium australe]|uniref:Reverse transcriptase n=1 Tax=Gossypium australe TaxID=47621 RepID=A0A5B6WEN3_9ROSI|nr:reverse transcriptase [Gossypium australe]
MQHSVHNHRQDVVNKFQSILHYCIYEAQSAFVRGRLITNNILTAYENLHSMKKKRLRKEGSFALKLDMSKVYNIVECPFINIMLKKMGFSETWGDPINPYSFLICSKGLSALLRMDSTHGNLKGVRINRHASLITHFLFTDDSLIFGEAMKRGARALKDRSKIYANSFGELINFDKSSTFFSSNVNQENREDIINPKKYLGLPSIVGRNRKKAFREIKEKK